MSKNVIIIGGTGHLGISLGNYLIKKNFNVFITTRRKKNKLNKLFNHNANLYTLNIYNKIQIKRILHVAKPFLVFYFAGQSLPDKSFKKKYETYKSNVIGCKNFLDIIKKYNIKCKFIYPASSEMYGKIKGKINIKTKKNPVNPYGESKVIAFNIVKNFREKYNLETYNAIIFNTESIYRKKNHLLPKICLAAIKAKKFNKKTSFGNLNISREWNWADEQMKLLLKFIKRKPQDFILSNGKSFSALEMINFAFKYFNLDYRNFVNIEKKYFRKNDINIKISDYKNCLKRNKLKRKSIIYGKKIIYELINFYQRNKI
tara:strand:- start:1482 stop:2429 length:948 start_codon:yes stop_codon:yes gene_type:complete